MNILLIDDHSLFRSGVISILEQLNEGDKYIEAGSTEEALALTNKDEIDIVLLDFHIPGSIDSFEGLKMIKQHFDTMVVVISGEDDPRLIRNIIAEGASGFIPKSSSTDILVSALTLIISGGIYIPFSALASVEQEIEGNKETYQVKLSRRQYEVLTKALQGKSNKVIANELNISLSTVKTHLSVAFGVLGVRTRAEAVFVSAKYDLTNEADNERLLIQG